MEKEKKCFVLMNHPLSAEQEAELKADGRGIFWLPDELMDLWKNIPPDRSISSHLYPIFSWFRSNTSLHDWILMHGDVVACHRVATWAKMAIGAIPVASTTRRESVETTRPDGSVEKISVFRHVQFREY